MTDTKYYAHAMANDKETGKPMPKVAAQLMGSYVGYSTDDKSVKVPNPQEGNDFLELDTGDVYIYDGEEWVAMP